MELKKFQLEASEKITNRYIAYMQNPLLIRRNEIVPFYQNLAAITGAGKTLVLADVVEQIRAVTTEQPIILWISKGKVVVEQMLDEALLFVKRNMRTKTIISPTTGRRTDRTDYPITAVREAIINALVHRDYSIHTEGMPIQLIMFEDRIEIHNPGGLYGRITIDQLGKIQPDTRNPVLASVLETLGITENRYSGIPTIRMEMEKYNLRQPEFLDERESFIVKLYKESKNDYEDMSNDEETNNLIVFCKTPRTRKEICDYLGLNSVTYAIQTYVNPLVEAGVIKLSIPDKPKSPKQLYYS